MTLSCVSGAKTAICELPFDRISSDTKGGAGGESCLAREHARTSDLVAGPHVYDTASKLLRFWTTARDCLMPRAVGTCVLRGCVPKKLMVIGGEFASAFHDSKAFGCAPPHDCLIACDEDGDSASLAAGDCKPFTCHDPEHLS